MAQKEHKHQSKIPSITILAVASHLSYKRNSWNTHRISSSGFSWFEPKSSTSIKFLFAIFFNLANLFGGEREGRWLEICRLKWVTVLAVARSFRRKFCVCSQKKSEWIHVGSWQSVFPGNFSLTTKQIKKSKCSESLSTVEFQKVTYNFFLFFGGINLLSTFAHHQ